MLSIVGSARVGVDCRDSGFTASVDGPPPSSSSSSKLRSITVDLNSTLVLVVVWAVLAFVVDLAKKDWMVCWLLVPIFAFLDFVEEREAGADRFGIYGSNLNIRNKIA